MTTDISLPSRKKFPLPKDKLKRFREFLEFPNCFEFPAHMKGKWRTDFFKNDHPIVVELGCGKGEYTVDLATGFPGKNFIGVDLKSNRMWRGAKTAMERGLTNVAFARTVIEKITDIFAHDEVNEIWITFPDPYPKARHEKNRLTHPAFLAQYRQIMASPGVINFKTDSDELFDYTIGVLDRSGIKRLDTVWDVHAENASVPEHLHRIVTHYEKIFMKEGKHIKYLQFAL
jgi:tRNA (guanine-N7-)-methyltransferase